MDTLLENTATTQSEAAISPQDGFLFIGELAKLTGTDPKTIRFYERADVLTLRRLGVPIAQIRDILDVLAPDEDVLASEKAINLLRQHLDLLKNRHTELTQQIEKTSSALHSLVA